MRAAGLFALAALALSLPASAARRRSRHGWPGLDDLGQQPAAPVARLRVDAHGQERAPPSSSPGRGRSAASAPRSRSTSRRSRSAGKTPRHLRHRERVGPRHRLRRAHGRIALEARARLGQHGLPADAEGRLRRDRHAGLRPRERLRLRGRDRQAVGARRARRRAARGLARGAADRSVPRARVGRDRARQRARLLRHRLVLRPPALQRARARGLDRVGRGRPLLDDRGDTATGRPAAAASGAGAASRITADGHVWAASANANISSGADEAHDHAESVVELSSALALLAASHAAGMPRQGRLRLRLDPDRLLAGTLRPARRLRGQGRRALPLAALQARRRAGAAARSWPSRRRSTARPPGIPRPSSSSSRRRRATPASRPGSTRSP